jgi:hypothetical protein
MVIALVLIIAVIVVGVGGVFGGMWLTFTWLRQFAPEREGELLAELAALRATQRLGREAGAVHRAMLRFTETGAGKSA